MMASVVGAECGTNMLFQLDASGGTTVSTACRETDERDGMGVEQALWAVCCLVE